MRKKIKKRKRESRHSEESALDFAEAVRRVAKDIPPSTPDR